MRNFQHNWLKILAVTMFIVVLSIVTNYLDNPPKAKEGNDINSSKVTAERVREHLNIIAQKPHPTGSKEIENVQRYILSEMEKMGVDTKTDIFNGFLKTEEFEGNIKLKNIIGVMKGNSDSEKILMISAHYDSVATGPGANDNGVSVSSLLEVIRALKNGPPLKNDIWFTFFDGEEKGMLGAEVFFKKKSNLEKVGLVVNFEARGSEGSSMMFQTSEQNGELIKNLAKSETRISTNSFMGDVYKILPNDSDLSVSLRYGIPGMNFAYIDGYEAYHTPLDNVNNVNLNTIQHQVDNVYSTAKIFGNLNLEAIKSTNEIYFNFLGTMIHYPSSIVVPLTLLTTIFIGSLICWAIRKHEVTIKGILRSCLPFVISIFLSLLLSWGLYRVIDFLWVNKMTQYTGATYDSIFYQLSFLLITSLVSILTYRLFPIRGSRLETFLFGIIIFLGMLHLTTWYLPGASYLFLLPIIVFGLVLVFVLKSARPERILDNTLVMLLQSFIPIVLFTIVFKLLFIGLSPSMSIPSVVLLVMLFTVNEPILNLFTVKFKLLTIIHISLILLILLTTWARSDSENRPVYKDREAVANELLAE
ncbi:M28 family peptidase [Rossellomorea vietnamensis]|uniref:M28 family peptidase n=1 Tax=Rossellomorea vietnamensis TaxID=218284 RepID=A0A5D4NHF3_9BACI|nr:M28 family peptidase [Rossellomorea vietnamensis]TYS13038.1 M28 family peptidase [Rossellomorea vietnamensis]